MSETPESIGKYKVIEMIAKGGMGAIYKAIHPSLKKQIVIKKMTLRGDSLAKDRFKKEAQILLDMQSPYIVHMFDYFTEGAYRYIAEEFVDGIALDKLIKKQISLPPQIAMLIMQDCLYALKFAHSKGVVHRDIKPGNILISKRAEIKLADFGIASDESEQDETKTKTGVMLGTPAYMPPEQFENSSAVDQRADIYALGVMLYEMLLGTKPYPSDMSEETFLKIRRMKYTHPRKLDKTIPKSICRLIHKMLQPKAKRRFQSVQPIIKAVKKYLKHYDTHAVRVELAKMVISPKTLEVKPFPEKKNIWKTLLASVVLCGIGAAAGFWLWTNGYIHHFILRKWYTPVMVEMKMPSTTAPASDIKARAVFFSMGEKINQLEDSERIFAEGNAGVKLPFARSVSSERPAGRTKTYSTKPVYLRHGKYRIKIVVGSYVWWQTFDVDKSEKILTADFLRGESRPIRFKASANDCDTGKDITDRTQFTVLYGGSWVPLSKVPKDKFYSANVWKFKASSEGYKDEIFSLLIDWYQDTVFVRADLEKSR